MKKILVTGGAGYVGSILCEKLLKEGYQVVCLDRFFFGIDPIKHLIQNHNFFYMKDDIRWFDKNYLKGIDCVLDLAALSNDPSGELDPSKTLEINYKGRVRVAQLSKEMGVEKYFLASTCSVYGFNEIVCDENSEINPLTTYAKASASAEKEILDLSNTSFSCTVFRFATLYGLSKRMRFDLVVNTMTLGLFQNKTIIVSGDGNQRRPLVDVRDAAEAYLLGIKSNGDLINGQIINVGSNEQNYKMIDLAREIGDFINVDYEIVSKGNLDHRSYLIDFSKIKTSLSFTPKYSPANSAQEIFSALKSGKLDFGIKTKTVDWYSYMQNNDEIKKDLLVNDKLL